MLWLKFSSENALYDFLGTQFIPKNRNGLFQQKITLPIEGIEGETNFKISLENHPKNTSACVLRFPNEALKITSRESAHSKAEILESYKSVLLSHMKVLLPEENWDTKIDTEIKIAKTDSPLEHTVLNINKKEQQQQPSLGIKEKLKNFLNQPFPKSKLLLQTTFAMLFASPALIIMIAASPAFLSLTFMASAIAIAASSALGVFCYKATSKDLWGYVALDLKLQEATKKEKGLKPYFSRISFGGLGILPIKTSTAELQSRLEKLYKDIGRNKTTQEITNMTNELICKEHYKHPFVFYPKEVATAQAAYAEQISCSQEKLYDNIYPNGLLDVLEEENRVQDQPKKQKPKA